MIIGKPNDRYAEIVWELAGTNPRRHAICLPDDVLRYIACPLEIDPEADVMERDGNPTESQCAACKRRWLTQEAK